MGEVVPIIKDDLYIASCPVCDETRWEIVMDGRNGDRISIISGRCLNCLEEVFLLEKDRGSL